MMKRIIFICIALVSAVLMSCDDDAWSEGDPAMEHVYYFGFENWGTLKNDVKYTVNRGETLAIPVQFHSERVRTYDVTVFYYVVGTAVRGTDYQIVDENGAVLQPDDKGAFSMLWPKAVKGVKNIYVKALNGSAGTFTLQTFNPNAEKPITNADVTSTVNNVTADYEVRAFSQNYKVAITIK